MTKTGKPDLKSSFKNAASLAASSELIRLKVCRDGFMAHTLRGSLGSRDGMQSSLLTGALENAEKKFDEVHRILTGNTAGLSDIRTKWRQRATDFWQGRLPKIPERPAIVGGEH
jgi:hypothetical protein